MHFTTKRARLILSITTAGTHLLNDQTKGCRRFWLLSSNHEKVGTIWYTSVLEAHHNKKLEVIILSGNKGSEIEDGWQFDRSIGVWDEWCLINACPSSVFPRQDYRSD